MRLLNFLYENVRMKTERRLFLVLLILVQFVFVFPAKSRPEITCGQTITENTILTEDLACPPDAQYAIVIGAPNITLDLGGHTISGYTPNTGVFAMDQEGITIRNGTIEGFFDGVFIIKSHRATMENLTVRNLTISDPDHMIFGLHIDGSQNVIVRDSLFEFISVAHKEAVEIFDSYVDVNNIEVRGGGAGVNFSFAGECDPTNRPSNGTVRNSRFSDVYIAGIEVACSSYAWIEGNIFTASPAVGIGIQSDAWFMGDVTGLTVKNNSIYGTMLGIEFRGILDSNISNNHIFDNQIWGIAMRQSLGCITPELGLPCFYSTGNSISDNETWGNGVDLYHHEDSLGNTWERNTCEWKEGAEIPECTPPTATLVINYKMGKPGSFFTLEGANFPANSTATIVVNGYTLGTVPTDATGDLTFLLNTDQADIGGYVVSASVNPSASASFVLDSTKQIRPQEGQGTIFYVPGGIVTHVVHLPLVLR
ncbi:MAG: right-handed parallel beta-helix repeat-containing protein [Chloroflexota bacterium]